jgi:hypothetical protein
MMAASSILKSTRDQIMQGLLRFTLAAITCLGLEATIARALAKETIEVADGKLSVAAPEGWKRKQPSSGIIEHEFAIPKSEGDSTDGRMTVMGAGGSIEANIDRWTGQFEDASGKRLGKDQVRVEKRKIAGEEVVIVDLSGTYLEKTGGPFAPGPTIKREKFRMLAGIVTTKNLGNYFFKFYGPEKTVEANKDAFVTMLESLAKK